MRLRLRLRLRLHCTRQLRAHGGRRLGCREDVARQTRRGGLLKIRRVYELVRRVGRRVGRCRRRSGGRLWVEDGIVARILRCAARIELRRRLLWVCGMNILHLLLLILRTGVEILIRVLRL